MFCFHLMHLGPSLVILLHSCPLSPGLLELLGTPLSTESMVSCLKTLNSLPAASFLHCLEFLTFILHYVRFHILRNTMLTVTKVREALKFSISLLNNYAKISMMIIITKIIIIIIIIVSKGGWHMLGCPPLIRKFWYVILRCKLRACFVSFTWPVTHCPYTSPI